MRVAAFILCEDVRFERYKKVSLIGVFDSEAVVPPADDGTFSFRIAAYVILELDPGEAPASFEFACTHDGESLGNVTGETRDGQERSKVRFVAESERLSIPSPGIVQFTFLLRDASGAEIGSARRQLSVLAPEVTVRARESAPARQ